MPGSRNIVSMFGMSIRINTKCSMATKPHFRIIGPAPLKLHGPPPVTPRPSRPEKVQTNINFRIIWAEFVNCRRVKVHTTSNVYSTHGRFATLAVVKEWASTKIRRCQTLRWAFKAMFLSIALSPSSTQQAASAGDPWLCNLHSRGAPTPPNPH